MYKRQGWDRTALILAIFVLIIAFPISKAIRNKPQDHGQLPDGDLGHNELSDDLSVNSEIVQVDWTASQAVKTKAFWLIALGHGFTSMVLLAIMTHLGLLLKDRGFDIQTTGWVVAAYTGVAMVCLLYTSDAADE